jgi:hypothetical protein
MRIDYSEDTEMEIGDLVYLSDDDFVASLTGDIIRPPVAMTLHGKVGIFAGNITTRHLNQCSYVYVDGDKATVHRCYINKIIVEGDS